MILIGQLRSQDRGRCWPTPHPQSPSALRSIRIDQIQHNRSDTPIRAPLVIDGLILDAGAEVHRHPLTTGRINMLISFRVVLIGATLSPVMLPSHAQPSTHRDRSYATARNDRGNSDRQLQNQWLFRLRRRRRPHRRGHRRLARRQRQSKG